jgi:hypothetical protein
MARKLLASALLLFMPFAGMRVVCVDGPADATGATEQAERGVEADCERLCPWHPAESGSPVHSGDRSDCAMTADGASFVVMAATSVLPAQALLQADMIASEAHFEAPQLYVEPGLSHLSPPPKA